MSDLPAHEQGHVGALAADSTRIVHESAPVPIIPSSPGSPASMTVDVCVHPLRPAVVDAVAGAERALTATVFLGGGDDPQLTARGARQLAAALNEAADIADNSSVWWVA